MRLFDIIKLAFKNLFRRKGRTFLTLLGILVGTTSVIIMLSMGLGLNESKEQLLSQYTSLEVITVYRNYSWNEETGESTVGRQLDDSAIAAFEQINKVKTVTPQLYLYNGKIVSGKRVTDWITIQGFNPESMPHFEYFDNLQSGSLLSPYDEDESTIDVVFGYNIPYQFYNPKSRTEQEEMWSSWYSGEGEDIRNRHVDPMNDLFKFTFNMDYGNPPHVDLNSEVTEVTPMKRTKFYNLNVVGYLNFDQDWMTNDTIYMSVEDMKYLMEEQKKYNQQNNGGYYEEPIIIGGYYDGGSASNETVTYDQILVKAENMNDVSDIQKKIEEMGYSTSSYMSYIEPLQDKIEQDQFLFLAIGCIAFFVAALNIINTMMMSTYERTREIGIMKVLGCRIKDIRDLFLLEAGLMGFCGGVLGVPVSIILSMIINHMQAGTSNDMMYYDPTMATTSSVITPWLCIAAIIFSALVGFISGLYPSIRAMKLSALDAIKNE
ncbi:MAG: ABC transporter permease [Ruminococcaceae bacterium]|nr:ABC transporter permease [Oscillospiraceae bacterium]